MGSRIADRAQRRRDGLVAWSVAGSMQTRDQLCSQVHDICCTAGEMRRAISRNERECRHDSIPGCLQWRRHRVCSPIGCWLEAGGRQD